MKKKFTQELADIIDNGRKWITLTLEYYKLTTAEKVSILVSAAVAGAVCLALLMISLILFCMCLVEVFVPLTGPALAYCIVAGICLLLMVVVFLLRDLIFGNAVARFITRLLLDKRDKQTDHK